MVSGLGVQGLLNGLHSNYFKQGLFSLDFVPTQLLQIETAPVGVHVWLRLWFVDGCVHLKQRYNKPSMWYPT